MKWLEKIILALGACMLGALLWKMDAHEVFSLLRQVGWGFAFIIAQEIVAHLFNALGWHFAYREETARRFGFGQLLKLRIVGDGINYLTPSASIAGEFVRVARLDPAVPAQTRLGGVLIAKCSQGMSQFFFALIGLALFAGDHVSMLRPYEPWLRAAAWTAVALLCAVALSSRLKGRKSLPPAPESAPKWRVMTVELARYFLAHPARCVFSIIFFALGFSWGAFEAYWICRFLEVPVTVGAAVALESLSVVIDGVLFMVPAKVGTQEAGKTAIFHLLGLPLRAGFAFGIVRHVRELSWAAAGLLIYTLRLKDRPLIAGQPESSRLDLSPRRP